MKSGTTYYDILQISPRAGDAEVRAAYYRLARRFHPDLSPGNKSRAESRIRLLNEAYAALRTLEQRKRYNALLRKRLRPGVANDNRNNGETVWNRFGSLMKEIFWPIADTNDKGA